MNELPDCTANHAAGPPARVGIVGGGFCGTLVLANLVEAAARPLVIELFEPMMLATGIAYSTTECTHLLNVRAERMGAFADQPDHFYRWLQSAAGKTATRQLGLKPAFTADSYVPRALYGRYLRHLFQQTLQHAHAKGITVNLHQATVTDAALDATHGLVLQPEPAGATTTVCVDALVLATGNRPRRPAFLPQPGQAGDDRVIDGWRPQAGSFFPQRVAELPPTTEIVIVGSGLTMVDTILTLQAHGYRGTVTVISRHAWLPTVHAHTLPYPAWEWVRNPASAPHTALGLLQGLRAEVARATALGYDWRSVVDSLRPVTQTLWKQLANPEKQKFLHRLFTLWNIHRHRMAPAVYIQLQQLQQAGRLRLIAGRINQVLPTADGLVVVYHAHGAMTPTHCPTALVINCTGPLYESKAEPGLLANLHHRGLITLGPLSIGVEVDERGCARGIAPAAIYPLGSLLVGELLECTAVPELREQAKVVADQVLSGG